MASGSNGFKRINDARKAGKGKPSAVARRTPRRQGS